MTLLLWQQLINLGEVAADIQLVVLIITQLVDDTLDIVLVFLLPWTRHRDMLITSPLPLSSLLLSSIPSMDLRCIMMIRRMFMSIQRSPVIFVIFLFVFNFVVVLVIFYFLRVRVLPVNAAVVLVVLPKWEVTSAVAMAAYALV